MFCLVLIICLVLDSVIILKFINWAIGPMSRVFANGSGDWGSIPGQDIPKIQKMVLDVALLTTQHFKVRMKGEGEQSRERSSILTYTLV